MAPKVKKIDLASIDTVKGSNQIWSVVVVMQWAAEYYICIYRFIRTQDGWIEEIYRRLG